MINPEQERKKLLGALRRMRKRANEIVAGNVTRFRLYEIIEDIREMRNEATAAYQALDTELTQDEIKALIRLEVVPVSDAPDVAIGAIPGLVQALGAAYNGEFEGTWATFSGGQHALIVASVPNTEAAALALRDGLDGLVA